jgi:hypothetical protein
MLLAPGIMQRWTAVVIGALLLAVIGALVLKGGHRSLVADAGSADGGREPSHAPAMADGGILEDPLFASDWPLDAGAVVAARHPSDAEPSALLPQGSPRMVRFGVILVQYRGAQAAPASSRSKEDALTLARSIAESARTDFKGQVSRGDSGSMEDAGRIPRGVLEPSTEVALFTMPAGGVSDPVDTPRGYWIVKRIE